MTPAHLWPWPIWALLCLNLIAEAAVLWLAVARKFSRRLMRRMNTPSKRATFSPDQEKSNVQANFQNRCRGRAGGWDTGRRRRSPQESRTTVACRGVLRCPGTNLPGQSGLSRFQIAISSKRAL